MAYGKGGPKEFNVDKCSTFDWMFLHDRVGYLLDDTIWINIFLCHNRNWVYLGNQVLFVHGVCQLLVFCKRTDYPKS